MARHGQGYSRFQHGSHGITLDLLQYVPFEDPIKISRLTLQNNSGRTRRLSVTAYAEWVLGSSRSGSAPYIITEDRFRIRCDVRAERMGGEFGGRIAFADMGGRQNSFTEIGRSSWDGTVRRIVPQRWSVSVPLSAKVGAGLDPCAAMQTTLELRPGDRVEIPFFLGEAENEDQARELVSRYRTVNLEQVFRDVSRGWDDVLGAVQVETPDPAWT